MAAMANVFKKATAEPLVALAALPPLPPALPALPAHPEGLQLGPKDLLLQPPKRQRYLYEAFDANIHFPHEEQGYQHYLEFCGGGGHVPAVGEQAPPGLALPLEAVADPAPPGAAPAAFVSLAQGLSPFPSLLHSAPPPPVLVHHRGKTLHFAPGQTLQELEHLLSETVLEGHEQGFSPSEVIGEGKTFSWLLTRMGSAHPLLPTTVCYPGLALEAKLQFNWQHVPPDLLSPPPPS